MDQAALQDKTTRKKKDIENLIQIIKNQAGSPERLSELNEKLQTLNNSIKQLEKELSDLLHMQDSLTQSILDGQDTIKALEQGTHNLSEKIRNIKRLDKQSATQPEIRIIRDIFAGTSIAGPNTSLTLKNTHRNVAFKEIRSTQTPGAQWEITIESQH